MLLSLQRSLLLLLLYTAVQCKAWSQTHPTVWQSGNKAVAALTVGFRQFPSAHGGEIFYYVKIKLWMVHSNFEFFFVAHFCIFSLKSLCNCVQALILRVFNFGHP